jgi:hypothetical protein
MGGTIALLAAQGHNVLLLDVTDGEPTPHGSVEVRAREAKEAAGILSAPGNPVRRVLLGLKNRFVEHTVENRHRMAGAIRAHQAQIVFVPYPQDAHPDHRAVTRIVEDARFDAKLTKLDMPAPAGMAAGQPIYPKWLFYYYATHLRICPQPGFLFDVSAHLETKIAACRAEPCGDRLDPGAGGVPGVADRYRGRGGVLEPGADRAERDRGADHAGAVNAHRRLVSGGGRRGRPRTRPRDSLRGRPRSCRRVTSR